MQKSYDVCIVGSGVVGLTLAAALAQQTSLSVKILENKPSLSTWNKDKPSLQVSAITLHSANIFKNLGVWDHVLASGVGIFNSIRVWDEETELAFHAEDISKNHLGFIVENSLLQHCLHEKLSQYENVSQQSEINLNKIILHDHAAELFTQEQEQFSASLVVAADGANSWVRSQCDIPCTQINYEQRAIVSTLCTELAHANCARQLFLPLGPLAFLPLQNPHECSIVWTLPQAEADRVMQLTDAEFLSALSAAFQNKLGRLLSTSERRTFSLKTQQAKHYAKPRVALVGDAAHIIHPLAGQGLNMGLMDAASLSDVITKAVTAQRDFASLSTLRKYERWRKADNFTLLKSVHALQKIFSTQNKSLRHLRGIGVGVTQELPWLKNIFTRYAVGERENLPKLAQFIL